MMHKRGMNTNYYVHINNYAFLLLLSSILTIMTFMSVFIKI